MRITISLTEELYEDVKKIASDSGDCSISSVIRNAVDKFVTEELE